MSIRTRDLRRAAVGLAVLLALLAVPAARQASAGGPHQLTLTAKWCIGRLLGGDQDAATTCFVPWATSRQRKAGRPQAEYDARVRELVTQAAAAGRSPVTSFTIEEVTLDPESKLVTYVVRAKIGKDGAKTWLNNKPLLFELDPNGAPPWRLAGVRTDGKMNPPDR